MSANPAVARAPSIKERRASKKAKKEEAKVESEQHVHWQINVASAEDTTPKDKDAVQTPTGLRRSPRFSADGGTDKNMHSILKANPTITKSPRKVFTRRKAGQDSAGRLPGQDPLIIDLDRLKKHFGVSQRAACSQLGIGLSTMKRLCRKFGIKRWPGKRRGSEDGTTSENDDTPVGQSEVEFTALAPAKPTIQLEPPSTFDFGLPTPMTLDETNLPSTRSATSRKIPPLWNFAGAGIPAVWPTGKTPPAILPPAMWGPGIGRTPPGGLLPAMWGTGKTPPAGLQPAMWATGKTPPGLAPMMWGRTPRGGTTPKNLVLDKDLVGAIASDSQNPFESTPEFVTPRNASQWNTPRSAARGSRRNSLTGLLLGGVGTPRNAATRAPV